MQFELRKTALANLHLIEKNVAKLCLADSQKNTPQLLKAIRTSLELLGNDIILLLNHNFYLHCRLNEKDKTLAELQKQYAHLQENSKLNQQMAKMRYQKELHHLQYFQFLKAEQPNAQKLGQIHLDEDAPQHPTPKKVPTLKPTFSTLDHKETLSKTKKGKEEAIDTKQDRAYDLEVRFQGVMSQQMINKYPQVSKTTAKSEAEAEKGRQRKRGISEQPRPEERSEEKKERGGKRWELAKLVAQQFKVPPPKEKYFSTDLL